MNAKRWFAWVCLALMLVAEILLFRSNHERDAAQADLRDAQQKWHEAQAKLDELTGSAAGAQAGELASLRKQNEALMTKAGVLQKNLDQAQKTVERLQQESQQTTEHLTTARSALELQQQHLQQLQAEQQRVTLVANATACINNLRMIDTAKNQWALEKQKTASDVPAAQDLLPYLKDGVFPACPDGGTYSINAAGELPTCSIPGHALPAQ